MCRAVAQPLIACACRPCVKGVALDELARMIDTILNPREDNVVSLRR
jgi:hypothetical protein